MLVSEHSLGLSAKSARLSERMIDDAAWITYPLHLVVGIIKTFVYTLLAILVFFFAVARWMLNAHDERADITKNFAKEQTIYRVNTASNTVSLHKQGVKTDCSYLDKNGKLEKWCENPVDAAVFQQAFSGAADNGNEIKHQPWFNFDWLADKSDVFGWAYIWASHNVDALKFELFHYGVQHAVVNAPVVYMSFLQVADYELPSPANAQHNWYTGMCLVSDPCTQADFLPRNTSIWYDLFAPELTDNQERAVKALNATGNPEFWIAAAHANGVYGKDDDFARAAAANKAKLDADFSYETTPAESFAHEVEVGIACYVLFYIFIGLWIARRVRKARRKCAHSQAN